MCLRCSRSLSGALHSRDQQQLEPYDSIEHDSKEAELHVLAKADSDQAILSHSDRVEEELARNHWGRVHPDGDHAHRKELATYIHRRSQVHCEEPHIHFWAVMRRAYSRAQMVEGAVAQGCTEEPHTELVEVSDAVLLHSAAKVQYHSPQNSKASLSMLPMGHVGSHRS